MADTVSTQTLTDTTGVKFAVKITNFSDGTGETLVKKVDASETTFMTEDGNRKISKIFYSINTANPKSAVELIWDGTDNATAVLLSGQGFWDLRADGNEIANNDNSQKELFPGTCRIESTSLTSYKHLRIPTVLNLRT